MRLVAIITITLGLLSGSTANIQDSVPACTDAIANAHGICMGEPA